MSRASISGMPRELLDIIIDYLDEPPPSQSHYYNEPSLRIISSEHKHPPLKTLSRVSQGFRSLILRRLFRHAIHLVTADARDEERRAQEEMELSFGCGRIENTYWPPKFHEFFSFLERHRLTPFVHTFVLAIKGQPEYDIPEEAADVDHCEAKCYEDRWLDLLTVCDIRQLTIIAPPYVLSRVIGLPIGVDAIKVYDIPYQMITLNRPHNVRSFSRQEVLFKDEPSRTPRLLTGGWEKISLQEGSLVRSLISEVTDSTCELTILARLLNYQHKYNILPRLKTFTYSAECPSEYYIGKLVDLLATLPALQIFKFSFLPKVLTPTDSDRLLHTREISLSRLSSTLNRAYTVIFSFPNKASNLRDRLKLRTCFENLWCIHCMDDERSVHLSVEPDDILDHGWFLVQGGYMVEHGLAFIHEQVRARIAYGRSMEP